MAPNSHREPLTLTPFIYRKQGPPSQAAMFASEFEGLRALRAAGVRAPEPYRHGPGFIEMERLDLGGRRDWPALARMLAKLHRVTAPRFGWATDNWIGLSPQKNGWRDDWAGFFLEFRLKPQLERARVSFSLSIEKLFENYEPVASLLHGDLWNGNVGFTPEGPVIFDPAVYYGDREADIAMTELFGGFPEVFYSTYQESFPLDAGYGRRKHLYNLYHLLNHLNLFGNSYFEAVRSTLRLLPQGL